MHEVERQRLADRLRAFMAADKCSETELAARVGVDQPFVCRLLARQYQFETPKVARILAYVSMRESSTDPAQIELPFETTVALDRFLRAKGDFGLLNSLIDVIAARTAT
jgi:hypothetical protein